MPTYPPTFLPQPATRDHEEYIDALAYLLATDDRTKGVTWVVGDVGMGPPLDNQSITLPVGYVTVLTESVKWASADGGHGGGGVAGGVDDWFMPTLLTIAFASHQYVPPVPAIPPAASAYAPGKIGAAPYYEQIGWRQALQTNQLVKAVLRTNITVGGEIATSTVIESKYMLLNVQQQMYRASRITISAQQRRQRGT